MCIHQNWYVVHMYTHVYTFVSYMVQDGISALFGASGEGHIEVVDTLLKNGADPKLVGFLLC